MNPFLELLKISKLPGNIKILKPHRVISNTLCWPSAYTQLDPTGGCLREPMSQQRQVTHLHTVSDRETLRYLSQHPEPFYIPGKGQVFQKDSLSPPCSIISGKRRLKYALVHNPGPEFHKSRSPSLPGLIKTRHRYSCPSLRGARSSCEVTLTLWLQFVFIIEKKNSFMTFQAPWSHTNVTSL